MKSLELIDCDIIQDLLPSYSDKILSKSSNKLIEKHLEKCKDCELTLKNMNKSIDAEILKNQDEEIDYLKGYKKKKIKSIFISVLIAFLIFEIGVYILYINDIFNIQFALNANEINVDYMYKTKDNIGKDVLEIHLCSEKYERLEDKSYIVTEKTGEKIMIIDVTTEKFKPFNKAKTISTTGVYKCIYLEDGIDKIYIDSREMKEIWNKDMEVMSEEEWKKSYLEVKIPENERMTYNLNIHTVNDNWRHLLNGIN